MCGCLINQRDILDFIIQENVGVIEKFQKMETVSEAVSAMRAIFFNNPSHQNFEKISKAYKVLQNYSEITDNFNKIRYALAAFPPQLKLAYESTVSSDIEF